MFGALLLAAMGLPTPGAATALELDHLDQVVRAELVAEYDAVAPGGELTLGLRLRHAPHWHTYWVQPGDAGLPTRLRWNLPAGYVAGPIQWPVPQRLRVGDLANYGYEGEVLLPITVRLPAGLAIGASAHFSARADWLVCNDVCIPGGADLDLSLPVRPQAELHLAAAAPLFAAARARIPTALTLAEPRLTRAGTRLRLEFTRAGAAPRRLEFFPLEGDRIRAAADQTLAISGSAGRQRLRLDLESVTPLAADFSRLEGVLVADGGPGRDPDGWAGTISLPLPAAAVVGPAAHAASGAATAPAVPDGVAAAPRLLPAAAALPAALASASALPSGAAAPWGGPAWAMVLALGGAFLGGLILNLMPCVFPVLSLKLIGLVQHRDETPGRLRAHGLVFAAGVVLSFLALAGLLLALRAAGSQVGWGFQLQAPGVIVALLALFFLVGLNLLGTFDVSLGTGLANSRIAHRFGGAGLRGSFATGVLAAVVASPCTAPFMGAALGFAITQPSLLALLIFASLGAGMASPYLLLTCTPAGLRHLPRPGPWMERLKQLLAFPMFLTCVWLFWVLGQEIDVDGSAWVLTALVALALGAWAYGQAQRGARSLRWVAAAAAAVLACALLPVVRSMTAPARPAAAGVAGGPAGLAETTGTTGVVATDDWTAWTPAVQDQALASGRPIFVDFTAAWCITCQANKRLVLHDAGVQAALRQAGVLRLRADWTRRDAAITRELARFARGGVPLYVLYDRHGKPHLLPEILSSAGVLAELASL